MKFMSDRPIKCRACPHKPHRGVCKGLSGAGSGHHCGCFQDTVDESHARVYQTPLTTVEIEALDRDAPFVSTVPGLIRSALTEIRRRRAADLSGEERETIRAYANGLRSYVANEGEGDFMVQDALAVLDRLLRSGG